MWVSRMIDERIKIIPSRRSFTLSYHQEHVHNAHQGHNTILTITATLLGAISATAVAGNVNRRGEEVHLTSGNFTYYDLAQARAVQRDFDVHTPSHNTLCTKYLRASYNGKHVDVFVADRCEVCN
ncbi:hypothetical protein N657DRAFT_637543 [Parathielavia appendiculata]|uniref:Uncharacterized protein n=1 Tax=Parathielavia appendiculata TaxID=2587402 RepID=A0AAN6TR70_9PEZI|nr:hypothetical protein N657DRAFT_637543 [Parathielavia appendiculata]